MGEQYKSMTGHNFGAAGAIESYYLFSASMIM